MYMYTVTHSLFHKFCLLTKYSGYCQYLTAILVLSRGNRLQYADRRSLEVPLLYNNAAINLSLLTGTVLTVHKIV